MRRGLSGLIVVLLCVSTLYGKDANAVRVWTSARGSRIKARMLRFQGGMVTLQRENGKTVSIDIRSLSKADREYIAKNKEALMTAARNAEAEKHKAAIEAKLKKLGLEQGLQAEKLPPLLADGGALSPRYLLYLPEGYGIPGRKWPLMLFLHGRGECGDDVKMVAKHGPPMLVAKEKKSFPCIIVAPQCPKDQRWNSGELKKLVDQIMWKLDVDESRLYVTGLSMGGYGTWSLLGAFPDTFAAAVPICGGGNTAILGKIKHIPIWAFHGAKDQTVSVAQSHVMVDNLKRQKGRVKLTVYPEAGHDSWTQTYANPEVFDWLFRQKKSTK